MSSALPIIFASVNPAVLAPPRTTSFSELRQMFLTALNCQGTKATYIKAVDDLLTLVKAHRQPISRAVIMEYRSALIARRLSASTVNVRLSAVRKLIREELATLNLSKIQMREGRWVIADLIGKGGRVRTVPVPRAVKRFIDLWASAAGITAGRLLRAVSRNGKIAGKGIGGSSIGRIVKSSSQSGCALLRL